MAQFRKIVVRPKTFHPPEGVAQVTPERIRRWVQMFKEMKRRGIDIPVPWGHQSQANPFRSQDREEYLKNRFNASYVDDLNLTPQGELVMTAPVPPGMDVDPETGDLIDPVSHTRIREVSLSSCDWKDGDGTVWRDAIRHIALTVLPVDHGEPGFELMHDDDLVPGEQRFSLSRAVVRNVAEFSLGGKDMGRKTTSMAVEDTAPVARVPGHEEKHIIGYENKEGAGAAAATTGISDVPAASVHPEAHLMPDLLMALKEGGVHLPADTTHDNHVSRLLVALHAIKGREGPAAENNPGPEVKADQPAPEHNEMAVDAKDEPHRRLEERQPGQEEHEAALEAEGGEGPKGEYREGEGQEEAQDRESRRRRESVKEEPMPSLMMSLIRANPAMNVLYNKAAEDDRAKRLARLAALKERGVPVHVVSKLETQASEVQFALTDQGIVEPEIDRHIRLLEQSFPRGRRQWIGSSRQFATTAGVQEVVSPYEQNSEQEINEVVEKLTTRGTAHRRKPGQNGHAKSE